MDYNALTVVLAFVVFQAGLSWNFHRIYLKLHKDFKKAMDNVSEKRRKKFSDSLQGVVQIAMDDMMDQQAENSEKHYELNGVEYPEKIKELYSIVVKAEEPQDIYARARDSVRTAHRYSMSSAIVALLGAIPAISGEQTFNVLYFVFVVPLAFAFIAWDDYSDVEKELVELRDKGE